MRLPLATTLKNRTNDTSKYARLLNAVVDTKQKVVKRPSLVGSYGPVTAGMGLGLFVRTTPSIGSPSEELIAIVGSILTTSPSAFSIPTHTLIAVSLGGTANGMSIPAGSITPPTFNGSTINDFFGDPGGPNTDFQLLGSGMNQDFFTSITSNGITLFSVDADFTPGVNPLWRWNTTAMFSAAGTYPVTIV